MSKMDNLRAMREARYAEAQKRAAAAPARPAVKAPVAPPAPARKATVEADLATDDLCGHRNISGRTCTREKGHAAKTHRYS
ncbi:hypothetical protein Q9S36_48660 [Microbacterium sp. ARD31]|uniref:hypothetical protein n=1 Tax=Microbacterium sp. ARD31 TaxID=2962576 RepID=UPI00288171F4|nr:hypothetical protein [Microbacterium sp. ARD31]MDT0188088.1 hypothetical protein [Microbacterium sp. ARD31]